VISSRSTYYLLILLIVFCSCENNDLKPTTRLESFSHFEAIELNDVFDVYLEQSPTYSVEISGLGDTPDQISFAIKNDTLSITNLASNKWLHPETNRIKLLIRADNLREVTAHATCYFETVNPITSDNFRLIMGSEVKLMEGRLELAGDYFLYWNNHLCGGKLTLTGSVSMLDITTFSTNSVDARNLVANQAYVQNNSKGNCEVFVKNRLEYSIRGTGNIYVYGNPPEILLGEKTASGKLIIR
jgi:hypothetical protein